jgi:hypothetical protein
MNCSKTKSIYKYLNHKRKLLHWKTNIKFNRTYLKMRIIPNYANIEIPTHNMVAKNHTNTNISKNE